MSNSSPKSVTPLLLEPGPSHRVRIVTVAGIVLALLSVAVLPMHPVVIILAMVILLTASAHAWRAHHALGGFPVTVRLDSSGNWYWQQGEQVEQVALLGDSYHVPWLAILNFRPLGKRWPLRVLLLTTDNIDADTFRRLRVHLNWQEAGH